MKNSFKSKLLATLLACVFGWLGAHRFYLAGARDRWGWLHFASLPATFFYSKLFFNLPLFITASPLIISALVAVLETFVLGLMPDDKWDQKYNSDVEQKNDTKWPIALILVFNLAAGATGLIAVLARGFDLLYTGGAYG